MFQKSKSINNSKLTSDGGITNSDSNDAFSAVYLYDQTDSNLGNTPSYSGRFSAVKWMTLDASNNKSYERAFNYKYDQLGRDTAAIYNERTTTATGAFTTTHGWDEDRITYDDNGNILSLFRNSTTQGSGGHTPIDNLTYSYSSTIPDQLTSIADATGNTAGFTGGTGNYSYDANGNLTGDPYKKLILGYDVLNKTDKITVTNYTNRYIFYTYDASGQLIRKQEYDNNILGTTTDYIGGFVYINGLLSYFPMPEGRVLNNGGTLTHEYIITDLQGNARISFNNTGTGGTALVTQENSYYAFGLIMPGTAVGTSGNSNKQLYNGGSEWQNDYSNMPDYYQTYYRNYDAAIARWVATDPEAEGSESMTVYQYAGNNPIMMNDPMGNAQLPMPGSHTPPPVNWNSNFYSTPQGPLDEAWQDSDDMGGAAPGLNDGSGGLYNSDPLAYSVAYGASNGTFGGQIIYQAGNTENGNIVTGLDVGQLSSVTNAMSKGLSFSINGGSLDIHSGFIPNPDYNPNLRTDYGNSPWMVNIVANSTIDFGGDGGYLAKVAAQMTDEFLTGTGPTIRIFENDRVARALQHSRGVNAARKFFYNKYKYVSDLTYATVTHFDAGFGLRGLISAGLNPIEQFVGNFTVNMWVDGTNLFFAIHNVTSFQSLTYDLGPNWTRSEHQVMGNTEQWYIFSEPINRPENEQF